MKAREVIARVFCAELLKTIGTVGIAKAAAANAAEADSRICHSHDYCNANQVMLDALEQVPLAIEDEIDGDNGLVDAAWSLAKSWGFSPAAVVAGAIADREDLIDDGPLGSPGGIRDDGFYRAVLKMETVINQAKAGKTLKDREMFNRFLHEALRDVVIAR